MLLCFEGARLDGYLDGTQDVVDYMMALTKHPHGNSTNLDELTGKVVVTKLPWGANAVLATAQMIF